METLVFTVYDTAAGAYLEPFFAPSVGFATRSFREAVNREGHQFNKFPDDFVLFQIGRFDSTSGVLEPAVPHSLGVAVEYLDRNGSGRQLQMFSNDEEVNGDG